MKKINVNSNKLYNFIHKGIRYWIHQKPDNKWYITNFNFVLTDKPLNTYDFEIAKEEAKNIINGYIEKTSKNLDTAKKILKGKKNRFKPSTIDAVSCLLDK